MMNKKQTHPYRAVKFLLLVPVVAVLLMAFSNRSEMMRAFTKVAATDTIPAPPPADDTDKVIVNAEPNSKELPRNVKSVEVVKKNGVKTITVVLKNGKKEVYNMNNPAQKKKLEQKYGPWIEPPPPPAPASPFTPTADVAAPTPPSLPAPPSGITAPALPSPPVPASAPEPYLPGNVKTMNVDKKNGAYKVSLELKDGTKENYDLNKEADRMRFEKKYGPINRTALPPPPVERKQAALNEKGYYLSIADNEGEYVVIVKDKNKKIVEATKLSEWDAANSNYENKYGRITLEEEIKTVPASTNASKDGPGNPYTNIKFKSLISNYPTPLYVVDGEERDGFSMNFIDPNTIESITVLKDKNATVLYGDKGKNGVLLIKTKKKVIAGSTIITRTKSNTNNSNTVTLFRSENNSPSNNAVTINGKIITSNSSTTVKSGLRLFGDATDALIIVNGKEENYQELDTKYKPEQIKSINVLKGEKAIAKYGDKGKNGVIEVELK
ncbi:MAG: TonB-dependent receptor plug domain-containing protein [Chitinophagaceae bacterium]|nr:TonB-dependent receptor plug domain-containing protein [Chitinophagaceae bacterium]